jgi:hypothetical protein
MHNANAFDDEVDAYPAITVIKRQTQGPTVVACAGPETQSFTTRHLSDAVSASAPPGHPETLPVPPEVSASLPYRAARSDSGGSGVNENASPNPSKQRAAQRTSYPAVP